MCEKRERKHSEIWGNRSSRAWLAGGQTGAQYGSKVLREKGLLPSKPTLEDGLHGLHRSDGMKYERG